jgi:hypothetical protein
MVRFTISSFLLVVLGTLGLVLVYVFSSQPIFEKDLALEFENNGIIPRFARTLNGSPFNGEAYGTFFGDRNSCVEWKGHFGKRITSR